MRKEKNRAGWFRASLSRCGSSHSTSIFIVGLGISMSRSRVFLSILLWFASTNVVVAVVKEINGLPYGRLSSVSSKKRLP